MPSAFPLGLLCRPTPVWQGLLQFTCGHHSWQPVAEPPPLDGSRVGRHLCSRRPGPPLSIVPPACFPGSGPRATGPVLFLHPPPPSGFLDVLLNPPCRWGPGRVRPGASLRKDPFLQAHPALEPTSTSTSRVTAGRGFLTRHAQSQSTPAPRAQIMHRVLIVFPQHLGHWGGPGSVPVLPSCSFPKPTSPDIPLPTAAPFSAVEWDSPLAAPLVTWQQGAVPTSQSDMCLLLWARAHLVRDMVVALGLGWSGPWLWWAAEARDRKSVV